jgi:hypothetical protein
VVASLKQETHLCLNRGGVSEKKETAPAASESPWWRLETGDGLKVDRRVVASLKQEDGPCSLEIAVVYVSNRRRPVRLGNRRWRL